jgi:manganese-transporting P-type ATPase
LFHCTYVIKYSSLQSTKKDSIYPDVWFIFQKSKYVYDWDKKTFHTVEFPVHKTYEEYMESKGFLDDEAIDVAEKEFGKNEMIMVMAFFV